MRSTRRSSSAGSAAAGRSPSTTRSVTSRISVAIRAVEQKTSGEIVCVLARTSSDAITLPILLAALVALLLPWLLVALTALPVLRLARMQPDRLIRIFANER